MSDKSLWEIHKEWVGELIKRGEDVLQPKIGGSHGKIWGYVKTQIPHKDAGTIYKNEKDGTFEILCDMCQYGVTGLKIEEIGLCDAKCWYEWMDENKCKGEGDKCYRIDLKNVHIKDLIEELLSREDVISRSVPHGKRFPDLSHDDWGSLRIGPAEIIIVKTFERKDGYKRCV